MPELPIETNMKIAKRIYRETAGMAEGAPLSYNEMHIVRDLAYTVASDMRRLQGENDEDCCASEPTTIANGSTFPLP